MINEIKRLIDECKAQGKEFKGLNWHLSNKSKSIEVRVMGIHLIDGEYVVRVMDFNKLLLTGWYSFEDFCLFVRTWKLTEWKEAHS